MADEGGPFELAGQAGQLSITEAAEVTSNGTGGPCDSEDAEPVYQNLPPPPAAQEQNGGKEGVVDEGEVKEVAETAKHECVAQMEHQEESETKEGQSQMAKDEAVSQAEQPEPVPPMATEGSEEKAEPSGAAGKSDPGTSQLPVAAASSSAPQPVSHVNRGAKKKPEDFKFLKIVGEGSFSQVHKATEIETDKIYAIKVCEKSWIVKQRKQEYIMREKDIMSRLDHPFCVRLYYTFQDPERLYFALSYCAKGEILDHLDRLGCFDIMCTQFYSAEIVSALEYLHGNNIVHRDLKPENILVGEDFHIQITDFGSAKDFSAPEKPGGPPRRRRNSFVGTPQFVSPEVLDGQAATFSSDLWALGCIIYQFHTGIMPFEAGHEYEIFQNVVNVRYEFKEEFDPVIKDVVEKLIVREPEERLGCADKGGWQPLMSHAFFTGIDFSSLADQVPPPMNTLKPSESILSLHKIDDIPAGLSNSHHANLNEAHFKKQTEGMGSANSLDAVGPSPEPEAAPVEIRPAKDSSSSGTHNSLRVSTMGSSSVVDVLRWSESERARLLQVQQEENPYHRFTRDKLILKQGIVQKKKPPRGVKWKKRMFLLTEGPQLFYIDTSSMTKKGEVAWSRELRPEAKNFRSFVIHVPNRTYLLEATEKDAPTWCDSIQDVWQYYYGPSQDKQ